MFAGAVYSYPLSAAECLNEDIYYNRDTGLAEGLNHSHGNVRSWERADKHKHSPYRKAQTWKTTP